MRRNVIRGLFTRPNVSKTTDDGERVCSACGAVVRDGNAHRDFHEALQQVARDTEQASIDASRRGTW